MNIIDLFWSRIAGALSTIFLLLAISSLCPAKADDVQDVAGIFSKMTDEEIVRELELRRQIRLGKSVFPGTRAPLKRGKGNQKLLKYDDATFGGNSGSGVFDMNTMELIGVLVRGEPDYVLRKSRRCYVANVCPLPGCDGEDVSS